MTIEETKEIWHYKDGVYVTGGEIIIEKEAQKMLRYQLKNKELAEIKSNDNDTNISQDGRYRRKH